MAAGWIERVLALMGLESEETPSRQDNPEALSVAPPEPPAAAVKEAGARQATPPRGRVVPMPHAASAPGRQPLRVVVAEPRSFEEVQSVAAHLKAQRPVVVTLRYTDRESAQRIVDFLSGTVYALDGALRRVSDDILLCTPNQVTMEVEGLNVE